MKPYYQHKDSTIYFGDCREVLSQLSEASVDSVVTDPPYGWKFMGKKWDYDVPSVEVWQDCLRVLKPGGHILVCCGTRTQHRMAVNIEDAGFEIRDLIAWLYASGFPKSLDIGKAIDYDACRGELERELGRKPTKQEIKKQWQSFREIIGPAPEARRRNKLGSPLNPNWGWNDNSMGNGKLCPMTSPTTVEAQQWEGWGTALKPSMELWTLARKPLEGTVAENVLKYGTGGLNIDGCRVAYKGQADLDSIGWHRSQATGELQSNGWGTRHLGAVHKPELGRFPANLILSYPDDEYQLRDDITEEEKQKLCTWLQQNL